MPDNRTSRILIIEDDVDIQYLLKCIFESENFIVDCASDGKEGLERITDGSGLPDVILLDVMMPVMDGRAFRKSQLERPNLSKIPTIVMSASREDKKLKDEMDAFGYLQKPVDIETLLGMVNRAMAS